MKTIRIVKNILLGLLAVVALAVIGLGVWQWPNLQAAYIAATTDTETIQSNSEAMKEEQAQFFEEQNITVNIPTVQDTMDVLDGNITAEELKEKLGLVVEDEDPVKETIPQEGDPENEGTIPEEIDEPAPAEPTEPTEPTEPAEPAPAEEEAEPPLPAQNLSAEEKKEKSEKLVNDCVTRLYSYEIDILDTLSGMKKAAIAEYNSLPKEERTEDALIDIGLAGLRKCYALEKETDAKIKAILADYKIELKALGTDTAVLDKLWDYYVAEKTQAKTYYMNKYL